MPPRLTFPFLPALLLALLTAVAFAARPLIPIDETRYVSVAWEMWLRGDWLVPFKNGSPYSHKPPLLFWLYGLGWAVTGVSEWWPRLVSPLFSLGSLLLTLSLGRRLWPAQAEAGRNAVWILGGSLLWMLFSTAAMFDVMLTFFALLGAHGLLGAAAGQTRRGFAWLGLAIGVGLLAKGPIILLHLLAPALLAPWWRPGLAWRRWYGGLALAVAGGVALALCWAIPAALRGGEEYARMIFWGQTVGRVADSFAHKRPVWWYLPLLPVLFFPWLLWPALWKGAAVLRREGLDAGLRFCLAWLGPVFLVLCLVSGKQVHYLIPLFPAAALGAGRLLADGRGGGVWLPALLVGSAGAVMFFIALTGGPMTLVAWQQPPLWPGPALMLAAALSAWAARRGARPLPLLALLSTAFFALLQLYLADNLWLRYDVRPLAREIRALQARAVAVANHGDYHAQYHFLGRLERPLEEVDTPASVRAWFDAHPEGVVVAYLNPRSPELERAALFRQPYRGEFALLLDAEQAKAHGLFR